MVTTEVVKKLILLFMLASRIMDGNGQDFEMICGTEEIGSNHGGKSHWHTIVHCPYVEYATADSIPEHVRAANQRYLVERLGAEFLDAQVSFRRGVVVHPERFDEIKRTQPWISRELCNGRIAYAFQYDFIVQGTMCFLFTTMFDEAGKLVGPHQIPDVDGDMDGCWISACEAKALADRDDKYAGGIENISFEYYKAGNCFVWKAQKPELRKGRKVTTPYVLVDARSGKVLDYEMQHSTIVCELGSW